MRAVLPRQRGAYLDEPASEMPTFQELADEIDGTLTPGQRDAIETKLAASPAAREAWADLAEFRRELAALPEKFHDPGQRAASRPEPVPDARVITPPGWRWRRAATRISGLAALLAALAVGWWVFAQPGRDSAVLLSDARGQRADLTRLPADLRQAVETALQTGRLPPLPVSALAPGREDLAGDAARPAMTTLSPVGVVVRSTRPTLRWTPRPDATSYRINLLRQDGGPVLSSPELPPTQTQWTPPEALARGETYAWQVAASRDGKTIDRAPKPPAAEALFQVLDAGRESDLSRVEQQASGYPLILGMAYWRAGIADHAVDQFHQLARGHAQSAIARQLERAAVSSGESPREVRAPALTRPDGGG